MARRQTRRAISVSRVSYESLRELAGALDVPMAQLVEQAIESLVQGKITAVKRESAVIAEMTCSSCGELGHKANRCGVAAPLPQAVEKPPLHVVAATPAPPRSVEPIRLPAQLTEPEVKYKRAGLKRDVRVEIQRVGLCAVCTNERPVQKTQLDLDGPVFDICAECNDGPIVERDHLFGGGSGIGDGNRRIGARAAGGRR